MRQPKRRTGRHVSVKPVCHCWRSTLRMCSRACGGFPLHERDPSTNALVEMVCGDRLLCETLHMARPHPTRTERSCYGQSVEFISRQTDQTIEVKECKKQEW